MMLEKLLHTIQTDINELTRTLDSFIEDSIQPTVEECQSLQEKMYRLQEHLAVYKHHKLDKELSPSFMIHAKVSEKEMTTEPIVEATPIEPKQPQPAHVPTESASAETTGSKRLPPLGIGLNDKFRFINELFAQNSSEYGIALEQLNNLRSWNETEIYFNSLRGLYEWKMDSEVAKHFYNLLKKRFE